MTDLYYMLNYIKSAYSQWSPQEKQSVHDLASLILGKIFDNCPSLGKEPKANPVKDPAPEWKNECPRGFVPYKLFCSRSGISSQSVKRYLLQLDLLNDPKISHGHNPASSRPNQVPHYVHYVNLLLKIKSDCPSTMIKGKATRALEVHRYEQGVGKNRKTRNLRSDHGC